VASTTGCARSPGEKPGSCKASCDKVVFRQVNTFAIRVPVCLHAVRSEGFAFQSFGFTAVSVYTITGRSSVWTASRKRSASSARSIALSASTSGGCGIGVPGAGGSPEASATMSKCTLSANPGAPAIMSRLSMPHAIAISLFSV